MDAAGLDAITLFGGLSTEELTEVAAAARTVRLAAGQVVVSEGEFAFDFYAITSGAADVVRGGERVGRLGPGDGFGELGVVPDGERRFHRRRTASVVMTEAGEAIAIDGTDLRRLADAIPALGEAIHATAAAHADADPR